MKLDKNVFDKLPIFGANQRPVQRISRKELKDSGVAFAAYGIGAGEVVEFPENPMDNCFQQPTVVGGNNMQVLVGVMRGRKGQELKPGYFAMGSLIRQDGNREYTCAFTKEMGESYSNHEERLEVLAGKSIEGLETKEIDVVKFDRATRRPVVGPDGANVLEKGRATVIDYVK